MLLVRDPCESRVASMNTLRAHARSASVHSYALTNQRLQSVACIHTHVSTMKKMAMVLLLSAVALFAGKQLFEKWNMHKSMSSLRARPLAALKDPASAQWRNEVLSADRKTLCGEINAKNSLGGYAGFKRFIANHGGYLIEGSPFSTWSIADNRTPVPEDMVKAAQLSDAGQQLSLIHI